MGLLYTMGGITGTGSYVPEKVITNRNLEKIVEITSEIDGL